jgi:signal peptidase I
MKYKLKEIWKKFWFLLWKDNSLKGWVFSLVFLFIFIKLIFFPVLNLVTGTSLPLAIVESCSMYHKGNLFSDYGAWWERHEEKYSQFEVDKQEFKDFRFTNGLNKGDILFITGVKPEKIEIGDVIVFQATQETPIIHRVIDIRKEGENYIFSTIGDNNNGQLVSERSIQEGQLIGRATLKIAPYLGWIKLIFFEYRRPPEQRGFCPEN